MTKPAGAIAVIFLNRRNAADPDGYGAAAVAMAEEAARQPGYLGIDSVRDETGTGITVSWWADEAAARAWRDHAGHSAVRAQGRATWYDHYEVIVAEVTRSYAWSRNGKRG